MVNPIHKNIQYADDWTRTSTLLLETDFESAASTNSATPAPGSNYEGKDLLEQLLLGGGKIFFSLGDLSPKDTVLFPGGQEGLRGIAPRHDTCKHTLPWHFAPEDDPVPTFHVLSSPRG